MSAKEPTVPLARALAALRIIEATRSGADVEGYNSAFVNEHRNNILATFTQTLKHSSVQRAWDIAAATFLVDYLMEPK